MARTICLTPEIDAKLNEFAEKPYEVTGFLVYTPFNESGEEYCPIDHLFLAGIGSSSSVEPKKERIQILNGFLRENPEYRLIRFHTHSQGTLEQHGNYYDRKFSGVDKQSIQEEIIRNPDHIDMLVTPYGKFLASADVQNLRVKRVDDFPDSLRDGKKIKSSLEEIARNLGYVARDL